MRTTSTMPHAHPTWGRDATELADRDFDTKFVALHTALSLAVTALTIALATWLVHMIGPSFGSDVAPTQGARGGPQQVGLIPVITILALWGYTFAVMRSQLPSLPRGRFMNGLAVGGAHTLISSLIAIVMLGFAAGGVLPGSFDGSWLGAVVFSIFLSQAGVILGALMSNAVLPEEGDVPEGTQHAIATPERSL